WEDEPSSLTYPILVKTFGKQTLGGGIFVGITAELQNAKVSFQARDGTDTPPEVLCTISGGNLVALDANGASMNPIYPTAYTQVVIAQSSSATIATPPSDDHLIYLINSLRGKQRQVGSFWYWNPNPGSGSDTNDGTTPGKAVATFSKAQTLASAGTGDTIFCLASNTSGTTTVTETLNITTANLKVMGPGQSFRLIPTATTSPTVTVAAAGVEVSGLYIGTATTGTQDAISVSANNAFIQDCWIANVRGHGVNVSTSSRTQIQSCVIEHCGASGTGDGVKLGDTTTEAFVSRCIIFDNKNGVSLAGTGLADNVLENNLIYQHTGYGITIGAGPLRTHVRSGHTFNKNTAGNTTYPAGYDTYVETQAGGLNATEVANAVWDEVISGHLTSGTTGKTLKDAKTKATLASLK
ncbi:MAG: hypothetical protein UX92_C0019G0018, partial [Candidatus Amesbacteria bacterium GW2011_GWA1_47_20]